MNPGFAIKLQKLLSSFCTQPEMKHIMENAQMRCTCGFHFNVCACFFELLIKNTSHMQYKINERRKKLNAH